jgi:broad specificity phosphatase PhoE
MKTVDLRRHAQVGRNRHELDGTGIRQAKHLARDFPDPPIFSSPAKRARQTAHWILVKKAMSSNDADRPARKQMDGSPEGGPNSAKSAAPKRAVEEVVAAVAREVVRVPELGFGDQEKRWREAAEGAGSSHIDAVKEEDADLVAEEAVRVASGVRQVFDRVPDGERRMAIGHSPLIEAALSELLPGTDIEPLAEGEGIRLVLDAAGSLRMERLRAPDRIIEGPLGRIFGVFILAPFFAFVATLPVYALLTWSFSTELVAFEVIAVTAALALTTLLVAFTVATGKQREAFLSGARKHGRLASTIAFFFDPTWQGLVSMLIVIFLLGVLSFSSLTALLYQRGVAKITGSGVTHETIMAESLDFYIWQLVDSVPLLDIPETARLNAPYVYRDFWTGAIVVIFKAFLILPLIRTSILAYRKLTEERPLVS